MQAYMVPGRMTEDPLDGAYPSRANMGKKRRKSLKRKMRSHKKGARQIKNTVDSDLRNE